MIDLEDVITEEVHRNFRPTHISKFSNVFEDIGSKMALGFRGIRQHLGLTQEQMGYELNKSASQIKKYESGAAPKMDDAAYWTVDKGISYHLLFNEPALPFTEGLQGFGVDFLLLQSQVNDFEEQVFESWLSLVSSLIGVQISYYPGQFKNASKQGALSDLSNYYQHVAEGLIAFRKHAKLHQDEFAHLLGISSRTYHSWECVKTRFPVVAAARFYLVTNVNPLVLMAGSEFLNYRRKQIERNRALAQLKSVTKPSTWREIEALTSCIHQSI